MGRQVVVPGYYMANLLPNNYAGRTTLKESVNIHSLSVSSDGGELMNTAVFYKGRKKYPRNQPLLKIQQNTSSKVYY